MANYESKVSDIFDENPKLARNIPALIRRIFNESESKFKQRLRKESEQKAETHLMRLFDVLFIDFFFDELDDRFLNWVINHYAERFSEAELAEMRAESESHLDFYEIQKVFPGDGCLIKSLITENGGFLKDVSSSRSLVKWDIVLARCYFFRGNYFATGALTLFKPYDKSYIIKRINETFWQNGALSQKADFADFAKNNWEIFFQIEREIHERALNKKVYTKYGELYICEVRFKVKDLQTVLKVIDSHDEFHLIGTRMRRDTVRKKKILRYQFDWLTLGIEDELEPLRTGDIDDGFLVNTTQLDSEENQTGIDAIGSLFVDQFLCRLETRSIELAEFAVRHFADLFNDTLVFKRITKLKSGTKLMQTAENRPKEADNGNRQQVEFELKKKFIKDYYMDLLDQKNAALNNMSPREARNDPVGFPLLIEWLKDIENQYEQELKTGQTSIPFQLIKKELNIDPE